MDTVPVQRVRQHREAAPPPQRKPFLTVHGNVMYDFYYQSHVDTPFLEKDIYQHTVQTVLDITIRDNYPLHLAFSTNQGNSSWFRDMTGINLRYSNLDFKNALLQRAKGWDAGKLKQLKELEALKVEMENKWKDVYKMRGWVNDGVRVRKIIELREKLYNAQHSEGMQLPAGNFPNARLPQVDYKALNIPEPGIKKPAMPDVDTSSMQRILYEYTVQKARLDSMQQAVSKLEEKYFKLEKAYGARKGQLMEVLAKSRNNKELSENLEMLNLPDTILPKGYRSLLAVKSVGIGRTMVDYSELTAKNISITGFQAEYNPSYYVAVATGAVDYRFRDFIVNTNRVKQYLNIVRIGTGMKDGNNIIASFYTGKKQVYNFNTSTPNVEAPDYRIMGFSLEGRWQLNRNNFIVGEVAKSSMPYYMRKPQHESVPGSMVQFDDHTNEAYAVSAGSFIPATGTRMTGTFKVMGGNFQSFSLYSTGSTQQAWMAKVDQPFFKQQLTITASIRKNLFSSIFENADYQSNTVFKSIQATFRRKHWPVVSLGYFPSSQLMKLEEGKYMENLFYTLVGTVSHFYQYNGISMNTMFSGTKFYNRQADSGFVYFNSTNLLLNQSIFLNRLTINGTLSSAISRDYNLHGADGGLQYRLREWLEIGGGLKYNYQTVYDLQQLGYNGNARITIPKLGEISVMADKGFVPGVNRRLVSNNTGRLTYTKIF